MDIGNYPMYTNTEKSQRSRSNDGIPVQKNPWDQIGDYEQGPATGPIKDDDDEEDEKCSAQPVQTTPKKQATQKEKQESSDAASIASQAAVKEAQKNQLEK